MIHYITTQGLGQPWVGNELYVLRRQNVPFVLHAMRRPEQKLFDSEWAAELNRDTRTIYPIPPLAMVVSMLLAPLLFRGRFVSALFNALIGKRESARARVATLAHFRSSLCSHCSGSPKSVARTLESNSWRVPGACRSLPWRLHTVGAPVDSCRPFSPSTRADP